jgi:hypothetical protein
MNALPVRPDRAQILALDSQLLTQTRHAQNTCPLRQNVSPSAEFADFRASPVSPSKKYAVFRIATSKGKGKRVVRPKRSGGTARGVLHSAPAATLRENSAAFRASCAQVKD